MKKTKIISIVVAMLAVVALGVFMGKYMFKLMEATTTNSNTKTNSATTPQIINEQNSSSVKILYGDQEKIASEPQNTQIVPKSESVSDNLITANPVESDSASKTPQNLQASQASSTTPPANDGLSFSPTGPKWFAYASTNGLNVRESPDKKGKLLFKVSKGTRGVVKEKKNGWSYIQWDFNKKKGWSIDDYLIQGPAGIVDNIVNNTSAKNIENIKKEQLTQSSIEKMLEQSKTIVGVAKPAPASETVIKYTNGKNLPQRGTITPSGGANIRAEASTKSNRLIKLPKGTVVGIKSVKQVDNYQWFEITYSNGAKTGWTREDNLQF